MDLDFQINYENLYSKFCRLGETFRNRLIQFRNDPEMGGTTLHNYQIDAVLAVKDMLNNDPVGMTKPSLIVAPTGAGKSGMIVMLPYVLQSRKVLVLTPSAIISNQLAEAFGCREDMRNCFFRDAKICTNAIWLRAYLEDIKVIRSSTDAIEQAMGNLVIVNAQKFAGKSRATLSMTYRNEITIENVERFFAQFDTLILDEAHHYPAETWLKIVEEFKKPAIGLTKKIVFLTATPYKIGPNGERIPVVGNDRIAFTITRQMCIGSSIRNVEFEIDLEYDPDNYINDIYGYLEEQHGIENRFQPQAMVLVKGRNEVADMVTKLNEVFGLDFAVGISGDKRVFAEKLKDFTNDKYRVAVTCKVGLEGYDNNKVTLCVIMRKLVTGKIMFSQFVGRCMRIRRGLPQIDDVDVIDRSVGKVLSYKIYELEGLKMDYESMDPVIADQDPNDEDDVDE